MAMSNTLENMTDKSFEDLRKEVKAKLNEMFREIIAKTSIDYHNQEVQDITEAVYTMLNRAADRINEYTSFRIGRIEPCGIMADKTSACKYDFDTGKSCTKFDFVAVLENV